MAYESLFGGSYQQQLGYRPPRPRSQQNGTGEAGQALPAGQVDQQQQQQTQAPRPTFAQMQQMGQARPAPAQVAPQAAPVQQYQGSQQAMTGRNLLQGQAQQAAQAPSRYDQQAFTQIRDAATADLDAQFANSRRQLDEQLAARGLYDSSIAANQYRDLGGQQARAMAGLNSDLLREAATTQAQDRSQAAAMSSQLAQLAGSQDLAQFEANRVGQAMDFENQMRSAEFGEGQRQFDVQGQLAQTLGLGGLDLQNRQLAQQGQQFSQGLQLSRDELALRGDLGQQEQELARQSLAQSGRLEEAQQNIQRSQLAQQNQQFQQGLGFESTQNQLNRLQQTALQSRELNAQSQQSDLDRQLQALLQGNQLGFNREALQAEMGQSDMDRQLRQLLGMGELGLGQGQLDLQRQLGTGGLALDQQRLTQQGQQFNQQLGLDQQRLTSSEQQAAQDRQLQQILQGNQLAFNRYATDQDVNQSNLQRQLQERLGMTELSGVYAGENGQNYNTIARDRLAVDREVGGNQTLMQLANLLGLGGLGDAFRQGLNPGTNTGTNTGGTPPPPSTDIPPGTDTQIPADLPQDTGMELLPPPPNIPAGNSSPYDNTALMQQLYALLGY